MASSKVVLQICDFPYPFTPLSGPWQLSLHLATTLYPQVTSLHAPQELLIPLVNFLACPGVISLLILLKEPNVIPGYGTWGQVNPLPHKSVSLRDVSKHQEMQPGFH